MYKNEFCLPENYSTLIDSLYAGLKNKQGFELFLSEFKTLFQGSSIVLLAISREPDAMKWGWTVGVNVAFERWCKENNLVVQNDSVNKLEQLGASVDGFISVGQLLNGTELIDRVTDNLKPWLRREEIIDTAALIIPVSTKTHLLLAMQRDAVVGKFDENDICQMNMLAPHIKQAVGLFADFYHKDNVQATMPDIQKLFNLTPTEAVVCQLLVTGLTLKDIARRRDVSVNTVREQMRQIYQKTGYKRQAEVVAAVLRCA